MWILKTSLERKFKPFGVSRGSIPRGGVSGKKEGFNMMNFIAIMCVFVGGYGVRWLCEIMQEED